MTLVNFASDSNDRFYFNLFSFNNNVQFQNSCGNYTFLPYKLADGNTCVITNPAFDEPFAGKQTLMARLKKLLLEVEIQSK
jgi:hypothetical protein